MKKMFYFVAVATFALFSCQNDDDVINEVNSKPVTFKASIEDFTNSETRGNINSTNGLVWADGDKIGIYVNDSWNDKNQPFTLSTGAGETSGTFAWDYGTFTNPNATVAFFPWDDDNNSGNGTQNNIAGDWMYFTLNQGNYDYTSGKMLTPLIASISSSDEISFKHAGAAVKVTINNLPAGAKSIGMTVNGQQVYGSYKINPANAGTDALVLNESPDNTKNTVWLNYTNNSESAWTFVFPVPTLTTPKLSFQIYDKNDVLVWSKNLKAQSSDLGRADILVMPALNITPYEKFTTDADWNLRGTFNDWGQFFMKADGDKSCVAKGVYFETAGSFKICKGNDWS